MVLVIEKTRHIDGVGFYPVFECMLNTRKFILTLYMKPDVKIDCIELIM